MSIDARDQLRSLTELASLVAQVAKAPLVASEFDWLEWKREADLSSREWHARIATLLCAFANREPTASRAHAGGCAYLLIGVEPGQVAGVVPIDNAQLHDGLSRFLGTAHVRWSPQYVRYEDQDVLVLLVEPPKEGDPIAVIAKEYSSSGVICREGDIFVRRHGKTERASPSDITLLTRRANTAPSTTHALIVEARSSLLATPVLSDSNEIERWLRTEENRLLAPLRADPSPHFASSRLAAFFHDQRTPEDYERQVRHYLQECEQHGRAVAHRRAIESDLLVPIHLELVNLTDQNYEEAQVHLHLQPGLFAYTGAGSALHSFDIPTPPIPWGRMSITSSLAMPNTLPIAYSRLGEFHGPWVTESEVIFERMHMRPLARMMLSKFVMVTEAALAGETMDIEWEATATSASGVARGVVTVSIGNEILTPLNQ